jgi:hypothetical protein
MNAKIASFSFAAMIIVLGVALCFTGLASVGLPMAGAGLAVLLTTYLRFGNKGPR